MKPLLLADDLSGALEAGAPFRERGWRVRLALTPEQAELPIEAGELRLVSTESRNLPPKEAAATVDAALRLKSDHSLVFKKIDSTLRGPLSAELLGILNFTAPPLTILTPANPEAGRTVDNGILFVSGTPVSETEFAADPVWPVRTSDVLNLLQAGGINHLRPLPLGSMREGRDNIRECMRAHLIASEPVIVCDAETTADLDALVTTALAVEPRALFVGSGALAAAVARAMHSPPPPAAGITPPSRDGGIVFVCGSKHPTSHRQMKVLQRQSNIPLHRANHGHIEPEKLAAQVAHDLQKHEAAAIVFSAEGPTSPETARSLNNAVGRVAAAIDKAHAPSGWFVTGGESAQSLCRSLNGQWLELYAQISPGTTAAILSGPGAVSRWMVTKPGGFGNDDLLPAVFNWWRGNPNGSGTATSFIDTDQEA